jgi:polyphosphate kinase
VTRAESRLLNRELSWLEFNRRVLAEAADATVPLLERLRFLAIVGANLDEFFMVRVGGLSLLVKEKIARTDPSGMTPLEQLAAIGERVRAMTAESTRILIDEIEPALGREGIRRRRLDTLDEDQARYLETFFEEEIYPVLTPVAIRPETPWPFLPSRLLHLAVQLGPDEAAPEEKRRVAIVTIPRALARIVNLPSRDAHEYCLVEEVIRRFLPRIFPGLPIIESAVFRITRNGDIPLEDDQVADLVEEIRSILSERKWSDPVRLEIEAGASRRVLGLLAKALNLGPAETYPASGPLEIAQLNALCDLRGFDRLRNESWPPRTPPWLEPGTSLFARIAEGDLLLHHPYESFEPVTRLLEEAADDPDVLAIKQTLYRTNAKSRIVAALCRAAANGKPVTAVVEIKARFDEERNLEWAEALEEAGVQVIHGIYGLKTHAKILLIVRRERGSIARYVHLGTGNYNESTARLYTDVGLLTARPALGADASAFFNAITGHTEPRRFQALVDAPLHLRETLLDLIRGETKRKKEGRAARIRARFNSLVDPGIIEALYEASQAGVKIELNVRGICALRPEVPGLSENITVVSIVDRFLEHSRIFHFHQAGAGAVYLSSADWMGRNLDRRIELMVKVEEPVPRERLLEILDVAFRDNVKAWRMRPDGSYEKIGTGRGRPTIRSQEFFYRKAEATEREERERKRHLFRPLKSEKE